MYWYDEFILTLILNSKYFAKILLNLFWLLSSLIPIPYKTKVQSENYIDHPSK